MNKKLGIALYLSVISNHMVYTGLGDSSSTTVERNVKQAVNFSGTLTTRDGETSKVDNIAIGRRYNKIPVYKTKSATSSVEKKVAQPKEPNDNREEIQLSRNPKKGIIEEIDLVEIKEIQVPKPDTIYSYKNGRSSVEYIEIIIISNDENRTKDIVLIDLHRVISCDKINKAGPIETKVPFTELKQLVIDGYRERDELEEKQEKKQKRRKEQEKLKKDQE